MVVFFCWINHIKVFRVLMWDEVWNVVGGKAMFFVKIPSPAPSKKSAIIYLFFPGWFISFAVERLYDKGICSSVWHCWLNIGNDRNQVFRMLCKTVILEEFCEPVPFPPICVISDCPPCHLRLHCSFVQSDCSSLWKISQPWIAPLDVWWAVHIYQVNIKP